MKTATIFAAALADAVALSRDLERLDSPRGRKLTAKAMMRAACEIGRTTPERAIALITEVERRPDLHAVSAFQRRMSRGYKETDSWGSIPNDLSRLERAFGSEELRSQLTDCGFTLADAVAMTVWDLGQLEPEIFGECDNPVAHARRVEDLRAKLADAVQRMRTSYGADDLVIDFAALSADERRRGLAKVTFRLHPDVPLGAQDWPSRLIACEMRAQRAAA